MKNERFSKLLFALITSVLFVGQLVIGSSGNSAQASPAQLTDTPYYGFTAFPYDATLEAVLETQDIIEKNFDLYAIHLDECLPW
ncbi:MAG: hypothetical protein GY875_20850 [Gammaproteobacteria bacterium]|nr:hypothetical protein [Gammaproteobacteria bacterium]